MVKTRQSAADVVSASRGQGTQPGTAPPSTPDAVCKNQTLARKKTQEIMVSSLGKTPIVASDKCTSASDIAAVSYPRVPNEPTKVKTADPRKVAPGKRPVDSNSQVASDADEDTDFETVRSKKRTLRKPRKRGKPTDNTPINTNNSYEVLSDSDHHPMDTDREKSEDEPAPPARKYKIPPIVFTPKHDHGATTRYLDAMVSDKTYLLKATGSNYKLTLRNPNDYRVVTDALKKDGIEHHTFPTTKTRSQRFIIRGLPRSTGTDDILEELKSLGFEPTAVVQLSRNSNADRILYPLFAVTLAIDPGTPAKDVSTISRLLRCCVTTEVPRAVRGPAQCHRCQRIGHATAYCFQAPRCVRCAENHLVANCPVPKGTPTPKCCNCKDGAHPASYRGCPYFKRANQAKKDTPETEPKGWSQPTQQPNVATSQTFPQFTGPQQRPTPRPRLEMPTITQSGRTYAQTTAGIPAPKTIDPQNPPNSSKIPDLGADIPWMSLLQQIQASIEQTNRTMALLTQTLMAILSPTLNNDARTP